MALNAAGEHRTSSPELALLASIVDSWADAIVGTTLDGEITSWNQAAETMCGYRPAEIIGRPILLLMADRGEEIVDVLDRIRVGGHFGTTWLRGDGTSFPVSLAVSPIHDRDGSIIGASSFARDVTRAHTTEGQTALMASIVNSSDDAIISETLGGQITSWNQAAEKRVQVPCRDAGLKSPIETKTLANG